MSATVESSFNDLGTTVDPSSSGTSTSINHEKATTSSNWNGVVTACQCCDSSYFTDGMINNMKTCVIQMRSPYRIIDATTAPYSHSDPSMDYSQGNNILPCVLPFNQTDTLINEAQLNIRDDNEWNDEESTTEVNDNIFGDHAIIMIMSTRAYIYLWK
ncbi:unnamed protein product [Rotaria magnacalcarata]|uniref:Uncharacterized protein n=1 Tax=Rotaria magnacalcarata TaxID=392030 RepID=A0A8S2VUQ8_9BILA|nr:unnamed protein product [Rotaria magnacalcarata]